MFRFILFICLSYSFAFSQGRLPHPQSHSHNDYEQLQPLWGALQNGFISVEADVHLQDEVLLVSHGHPTHSALTLQQLYLSPLDSILARNAGKIYPGYEESFYLMIDCKTEAESTYKSIRKALEKFPRLQCQPDRCPVKIFISGNRAIDTMIHEGYLGLALDGRPGDLGKGISADLMPVVSDHFANWSSWKGKTEPQSKDLARIQELAQRVHAEGKKLRLWAIPDNELTWKALLDAGVDLINTDRPEGLHLFLTSRGL